MRVLITGSSGQVGWELRRSLQCAGLIACPDRSVLDLSRPDTIAGTLDELRPDLVVNAAAYTAVDAAETDQASAMRINAQAPGAMAAWCAVHGARLVHFSTDYVFNGANSRPWREWDAVEPASVYGESKYAGEQLIRDSGCAHLILRTSWVYASRGKNFLRTVIRLARSGKGPLRIVADQSGAPTWARTLAEATLLAIRKWSDPDQIEGAMQDGTFHVSASGTTNWHEFASLVVNEAAKRRILASTIDVHPIATAEYPTAAKRPVYSVLDCSKFEEAFSVTLPDWRECVGLCLDEIACHSQC